MISQNLVLSVLYLFCIAKANSFLQLNGYKMDRCFFKYFKTDFSAFAIVFFWVSMVFFVMFNHLWLYAHAVLTITLGVVYLIKPKKTPLRLTWRMKRLYFTEWVLLVCLAFLFNPVVFLLLPFVALFANVINSQMEFCIQAGFLQKAKTKIRLYPNLKVIAITGSYAKTSVKNFLTDMLSQEYKVIKTPHSFNTPMGIAKTINQTDFDGVDFFVCEMGARRIGDIKELCDIITPDVAVITGISPQHLQTFGSLDNVVKTKLEILQGTKKDGLVFVNGDCSYLTNLPQTTQQVFVSGKDDVCHLQYTNVVQSKEGLSFNLQSEGLNLPCKTKLLGVKTVSNLCLASLVGLNLGLKPQSVANAIQNLDFVPHRMQLLSGNNGIYVLDDSYNANIEGVFSVLETLSIFDGQKFVVMSGVVEGGKMQDGLNLQIGEKMATCCDFALLVGINSKSIMQGLLQNGFDQNKIFCCDSITDGVNKANLFMQSGDVILFCNDLPDNFV